MHRRDPWRALVLGAAIVLPAVALAQSGSTQSDSNTWQQAAKTGTSGTEDHDRQAATTGDDFDTLDTDHDGRISRAEAGASQEFSGRFKTLDADGDGYVTHDEYRDGERATRTPTSTH